MTKTKILLVEDDKSLREIYGVRLYEEGYDIVSAGDGEEALAMAIKDRPDLIISDVMMPKISGFDMLDILRSTTETKNIKVIIMTALSSEEQRQRGVSLGADRYLVKSQVGIEDVVRTVHEILQDAPIAGQPAMVSRPAAPVVPAPRPVASPPAPRPTEPLAQASAQPSAPAPSAPAQPAPVQSAPIPTPPAQPQAAPVQPMKPVQPIPVQPAPAQPQPIMTPSSPTSIQTGPPAQVQESTLPEPTAPFSTPRINGEGTLADRVIQPIEQPAQDGPDIAQLMDQALGGTATVTQPAQPAPVQSAPIPTPPEPTNIPPQSIPIQPSVPQAPIQPGPGATVAQPTAVATASPLSSQNIAFEETPRTAPQAQSNTTPPPAGAI